MAQSTQMALQQYTSHDYQISNEQLNKKVHKSELLDVDEDDDYVDEFLRDEDDAITSITQEVSSAPIEYKLFGSEWLNETIKREIIDKYQSYLSNVLKPEPARVTPFELQLKDPNAWYGNKAHKRPPPDHSQRRRKLPSGTSSNLP
jgi:hypothetical protein